jgi:hypothetical protein
MGLWDKRSMEGEDSVMMHSKFPDVNGAPFLWRDRRKILHASKEMTGDHYAQTLCGKDTRFMDYAGRMDAPTCLECATKP